VHWLCMLSDGCAGGCISRLVTLNWSRLVDIIFTDCKFSSRALTTGCRHDNRHYGNVLFSFCRLWSRLVRHSSSCVVSSCDPIVCSTSVSASSERCSGDDMGNVLNCASSASDTAVYCSHSGSCASAVVCSTTVSDTTVHCGHSGSCDPIVCSTSVLVSRLRRCLLPSLCRAKGLSMLLRCVYVDPACPMDAVPRWKLSVARTVLSEFYHDNDNTGSAWSLRCCLSTSNYQSNVDTCDSSSSTEILPSSDASEFCHCSDNDMESDVSLQHCLSASSHQTEPHSGTCLAASVSTESTTHQLSVIKIVR